MSNIYRFEIYKNEEYGNTFNQNEESLKKWINKYLKINIKNIWEARYFMVETNQPVLNFHQYAEEVFVDPVIEFLFSSDHLDQTRLNACLLKKGLNKSNLIDVSFRPGVTDNSAHAAHAALKLIPALSDVEMKVAFGSMYYIDSEIPMTSLQLEKLAYEKLANNLLHKVVVTNSLDLSSSAVTRMKEIKFPFVSIEEKKVLNINFDVSEDQLLKMNLENCWALSLDEMLYIKEYYQKLKRSPTDVEIEIIAQSWSEHCKHKIFSSKISYTEDHLAEGVVPLGNLEVDGLFKSFIRGSTLKIKEDRNLSWLISIFHDNAGIVRFDNKLDVCIKVETHNSPSALDPYGGALTGILGVNRDILGVGLGAKPVANTDVFCLAINEYFEENNISIPLLLKNPDRIKEGVHHGVMDGGNKSGIPTINGAFVYDRDFVGKPLVFCGTVGVIPQIENGINTFEKRQKPGDLIVMSGGRIGKDGIHGATFSSMELVDGVPSSVVQIGDPITQKRLGDFLIEARSLGLFNSVTDNGAGGLSSSVGEMAALTNGAMVDLEKALVKYPGLSPFELMVSESQERMTFSVPVESIADFLALSLKRGVESSVIGEFTQSGFLLIRYFNKEVANINLHFLHESLRPLELKAHFDMSITPAHFIKQKIKKPKIPFTQNHQLDYKKILLNLLGAPNIKSHEELVRRYDHEVKAATIVKPFTGTFNTSFSAPTDGGVFWMKPHGGEEDNAIAIASGICPKISQFDTYLMAIYAVDEAVRNGVSVGADPDQMVLVDNFCWPDPILSERNLDGEFKLAQLVRSAHALYDISIAYGMPFVSGKDSMKNDFIGLNEKGEKIKISVPPTLLVTAMGRVPSLSYITTSEIKNAKDLVYLIGESLVDFNSFYEFENFYDLDKDFKIKYPLPSFDFKKQILVYRQLHQAMKNQLIESCHDISDGGLILSLVEKMMGTSLGLDIELNINESDCLKFLFNESAGRMIVTINPNYKNEFETLFKGFDLLLLGKTNDLGFLSLKNKSNQIVFVTGEECLMSYKSQSGDV